MSLKKHIALLSVYPPPFGGVSVHAKILARELSERNMINVFVTGGHRAIDDPGYLKRISDIRLFNKNIFWHFKIPFILALYSKKIKVIHCHEGLSVVPFLFFHRFVFKKAIIHTLHNQWVTERYNQLNFFSRFFTTIFLKDKKSHWICVNGNAYHQMLKLGTKKECISIIPAYIPNTNNTEINRNDYKIIQTIKEFKSDAKLIGVYGVRFAYDTNGQEIYGFHFSIDVFKKLLEIQPNIKLVILVPNALPLADKERVLLKINNEGLSAHVLTIFDNPIMNMNLFWNQLDIYFRPTTDDGDSLAIREASASGITVVASDVCQRPNNIKVYKSLDIESALKSLTEAIDGYETVKINDENFLLKLLKLYADKS